MKLILLWQSQPPRSNTNMILSTRTNIGLPPPTKEADSNHISSDATIRNGVITMKNRRDDTITTVTNALRLRHDWTNLPRYSILAHRIANMQNNCSIPILGNFWYRNRFGLGSDLHVYSVAMCNALQMHQRVRVRTVLPWIWYDQQSCGDTDGTGNTENYSAMACYFPESEPACLHDGIQHPAVPIYAMNLTRPHGKITASCTNVIEEWGHGSVATIRAATIEFLFTRVSNLIQDEAQRQLQTVFRGRDHVPHNLITVHIRWGDKSDEMKLVPISKYIHAVQQILEQRKHDNQQILDGKNATADQEGVHIYLATEDPEALDQFMNEAPSDWKIYVDQYYYELLPHRSNGSMYNSIPQIAQILTGRPGVIALGSLLVAMEANDYVLTTASNWSRLMNEIRLNIVNPRCNNCTTMIDLNYGEW
jgi:hypothetical protein